MPNNIHVILSQGITAKDLVDHPLHEHTFSKVQSAIVDSEVYRLQLPETFRFQTFIELITMEDDSIEFIFTRPKSSRWHEYFYDEIIDELSAKSADTVKELELYIKMLEAKNLVSILKDEPVEIKVEEVPLSKTVKISIGNQYELLMMLLSVEFNKTNQQTKAEQKLLEKQIIPISDNTVVEHILNQRGLTPEELNQLISAYKESKNIDQSVQISIDEASVLSDILIELKKSDIFKEERQKIRTKLIQAGETTVDYAVFDKKNNLTFHAAFGQHYDVLTSIIAKYHYDEFMSLSQKEKDQFILDNFLIIGSYYPDNSPGYNPDIIDIDYKKRHKIDIQPAL